MSTYAFKNVVGAFTHPLAGVFPFRGQLGVKTISVQNAVDRGVIDVASDGATMVSYVAGANGGADIEMQQNSEMDEFLTSWANLVMMLADQGDASQFAAAAIRLKDTLSGQSKTLTGVFPVKIPDKSFGREGGNVTWRLLAANVLNQ